MLSNRTLVWRAIVFVLLGVVLDASSLPSFAQAPPIPQLRQKGSTTQLVVDGKPFLILGGELGNSSASSLEYLEASLQKLEAMHVNTVLAPVYWDLIEPSEGKFDFSLVDGLLRSARTHKMRVVLLWFGSWKNSMSCYAPAWVKTNLERFPRAQDRAGRSLEILSPFEAANVEADTRAFAALMRHVRQVDSKDRTVVMVQVENEIGMIPEARDRSAVAERLFAQDVPKELTQYLLDHRETLVREFGEYWAATGYKSVGTWEQCFGRGLRTEEIFMAWHFGRYTNRVAEAGKAEYALPMFVNAALIRPGYVPGQYPSAGPLPHLMDVWRAAAPKIDFLAPDIYFPNFAEWVGKYHQSGNPLFVPEVGIDPATPANALYAFGQHDAMGFSPFSIESIQRPEESPIGRCYAALEHLAPLILEHQGMGAMAGLLADSTEQRVAKQVRLGGYLLNVTFERPQPSRTPGEPSPDPVAGGLVIAVGPDEFVIAGTGLIVTFDVDAPGDTMVGILWAQEGKYANGRWLGGRWLNGDQTHQGRHVRLHLGKFDVQRFKLYRYR